VAELSPRILRAALPAGATALTIAYSGGRDSHVLLHLAARSGLRLRALHVDHRLHPDSAAWAEHCRGIARGLGVPLTQLTVRVTAAGEGEEGAARRARYAALAAALAPGEHLATAHHADDQAETLLLRLLRGTGPDGLAGILPRRDLAGAVLLRPLLGVPGSDLEAYAQAEGLQYLEDPANREARHERSWLRQTIMPQLAARRPGVAQRLAALAERAREERELRALLLDERLRALAGEPPGPLPAAGLTALPPALRGQLVRRWIGRDGRRPPPARRLETGLAALLGAGGDRQPVLVWADGSVCRHAGLLFRLPAALPDLTAAVLVPPPAPTEWPGLGRLAWRRRPGAGIGPHRLAGVALRARAAAAGERFRPAGRPRRALKHWLREAGVPTWWRGRLPLIETPGGEPVAVAGLLVAEGWQARPGEAGWWPDWQALPAPPQGDAAVLRITREDAAGRG